MATSSSLFLATIYNQSQLAERKHVARYWSINTAATAVLLSAHPSPIEVAAATAKQLAAAIFGGGGGCTEEVFCRPMYCPCVLSRLCQSQIGEEQLNMVFFSFSLIARLVISNGSFSVRFEYDEVN